jgi:hypothetical protein
MRLSTMPLGVILIALLVATVMTIVLVPHRGIAMPQPTLEVTRHL